MFLALEQIISKGKVSTEELRRQLGEKVPGAMNIMAEALNVTVGELDGMLRRGEVLSETALPKFAKEIEKTFGLENVDRINTLAAAQERFGNAWIEFVRELEANNVFADFFERLSRVLGFIQRNSKALLNLTKAIITLTAAYAGYRLVLAATSSLAKALTSNTFRLVVANRALSFSTRAATASQLALNSAMALNPMGLLVTSIIAVVGALALFDEGAKEVEEELSSLEKRIDSATAQTERLFFVIKNYNKQSKTRKDAIKELNDLYPEYLSNLDIEKSTLEEIESLEEKLVGRIGGRLTVEDLSRQLNEIDLLTNKLETARVALEQGRKVTDQTLLTFSSVSDPIERQIEDIDFRLNGLAKTFDLINRQREDALQVRNNEKRTEESKLIEENFKKEVELDKLRIDGIEDKNDKELALLDLKYKKLRFKHRDNRRALELIDKGYEVEFNRLVDRLFGKLKSNQSIIPDLPSLTGIQGGGVGSNVTKNETLALNKSLRELKFEEELERAKLRAFKSTEEEKTLLHKEFLKKRLEAELKFLEATSQGDSARAKGIRRLIANLTAEIEILSKGDPKGRDIFSALGLKVGEDEKQAINDSVNFSKGQIQQLFDFQAQIAAQRVQQANTEVASAERALAAEMQARNLNQAHKITTRQKELEDARKNQQKALEQQKKAQQQQIILDAISQSSNLITASTTIWSQLGFPFAIPAIATMWGSYIFSKVRAAQLVKKKFGKGTEGVEILGGGSHASDDDTYLGFQSEGRPAYGERGEAVAIFSKKRTQEIGARRLNNMIRSIQAGELFDSHIESVGLQTKVDNK